MTTQSKLVENILEDIRNGYDPVDIVIKYGVDPDIVIRLYDEYLEHRLQYILYQIRHENFEDQVESRSFQPVKPVEMKENLIFPPSMI